MAEHSRRSFLKSAAASGALTTGAVLLPAGLARAAASTTPRPGAQRRKAPQTPSTSYSYRLHVTNNSNAFEQFAVFQNDPDLGVTNVLSLAWLVQGVQPQKTVVFEWTEDYSFTLFEQNANTHATRSVPVDPHDPATQQVQLGYTDGALTFQNGPAIGTPQFGSVYLRELGSIPAAGAGLVGLAIDGKPAYAAPAAPNTNLVFTFEPGLNYWLGAGTFEAGATLDVEAVLAPTPIDFPPGVFDLTAVLKNDNTWTVAPTSGGGTA